MIFTTEPSIARFAENFLNALDFSLSLSLSLSLLCCYRRRPTRTKAPVVKCQVATFMRGILPPATNPCTLPYLHAFVLSRSAVSASPLIAFLSTTFHDFTFQWCVEKLVENTHVNKTILEIKKMLKICEIATIFTRHWFLMTILKSILKVILFLTLE